MPREQLTGKAIGGPRDGIKLSAGLSWDGKVEKPKSRQEVVTKFFPGKYQWNLRRKTWVWIPDKNK